MQEGMRFLQWRGFWKKLSLHKSKQIWGVFLEEDEGVEEMNPMVGRCKSSTEV